MVRLRVDLLILKFVVDLLKLVYWYLVVMVWYMRVLGLSIVNVSVRV